LPGGAALGWFTSALGIAGVIASACIYRVPSRPAWDTPMTLVQFNLTGAALGPLLAAAIGASGSRWLVLVPATMAGAQLVLVALRFVRLVATDSIELRGTARLLSTTLKPVFVARGVLLALGGIVLPLIAGSTVLLWSAFVC